MKRMNVVIISLLFFVIAGCNKGNLKSTKQESAHQDKIELEVLDAILNDSIVNNYLKHFDNHYTIVDKNNFLQIDSVDVVQLNNHNLQIIPKFTRELLINLDAKKVDYNKYSVVIEVTNKYGGRQFYEAEVLEDSGEIRILSIFNYEL